MPNIACSNIANYRCSIQNMCTRDAYSFSHFPVSWFYPLICSPPGFIYIRAQGYITYYIIRSIVTGVTWKFIRSLLGTLTPACNCSYRGIRIWDKIPRMGVLYKYTRMGRPTRVWAKYAYGAEHLQIVRVYVTIFANINRIHAYCILRSTNLKY